MINQEHVLIQWPDLIPDVIPKPKKPSRPGFS